MICKFKDFGTNKIKGMQQVPLTFLKNDNCFYIAKIHLHQYGNIVSIFMFAGYVYFSLLREWWVEEEHDVANWSKCYFPLIPITFTSNWWYFITADLLMNPKAQYWISVYFLWFLSIVSNLTKVLHNTTPISRTVIC